MAEENKAPAPTHDPDLQDVAVKVHIVADDTNRPAFGYGGAAGGGPAWPTRHRNWVDENNMPAGGTVEGRGYHINWQDGPVSENGVNGAQVIDILKACYNRVRFLDTASNGLFACDENTDTLEAIHVAIMRQRDRDRDRAKREVEGTHQP